MNFLPDLNFLFFITFLSGVVTKIFELKKKMGESFNPTFYIYLRIRVTEEFEEYEKLKTDGFGKVDCN